MTDLDILSRRDDFLRLTIERLGDTRNDFCETMDFIRGPREGGEAWQAAGVLLPLLFREKQGAAGDGEFVFRLIKRSSDVVQSGDISCPGGMLHKFFDPLLRPLIAAGFPPVLQGDARTQLKKRGGAAFDSITLFLANAVRESWEELRINPFHLKFLGPLPCRPLLAFARIIFPLTGYVRKDWKPKLNWEVEKILELPLRNFFDEDRYALFTIETDYKLRDNISGIRHFPCFIVKDHNGDEDILWGATFSIVMSFLKIVLDFEIPELDGNRTLSKVLSTEYLTGNRNKK
jgi:8-oxo-dGTP pyrophosphatase MutT (NUDIX family)